MNLLILPDNSTEVCIEIYSIDSFKTLKYKKKFGLNMHIVLLISMTIYALNHALTWREKGCKKAAV